MYSIRHLYEWLLLIWILCNEMEFTMKTKNFHLIFLYIFFKILFLPLYPFVDWHSSSQRDKFNFFLVICVLEKHHLLLKHAKWFENRREENDEQNATLNSCRLSKRCDDDGNVQSC